jgi:hypothetical protein
MLNVKMLASLARYRSIFGQPHGITYSRLRSNIDVITDNL